jgi:hypothetical protein
MNFDNQMEPFPFLRLIASRFRDDPPAATPGALYMGDSVLERVSDSDSDRRTLSEMVVSGLTMRCIAFSMPSYTPIHMLDYARVLASMPRKLRLFIAPFNIRGLSPQWFDNPRYQQRDHRDTIAKFLEDPSGPVPSLPVEDGSLAENPEAVHAFRSIEVRPPFTRFVTVGQLEDRREARAEGSQDKDDRTADLLTYHYGLDTPSRHPCLDALTALVRVLNENDIRVLLYATPINVELARARLGAAFTARIQDRINAAAAASRRGGTVEFADLHAICPAGDFLHRNYVVEHLNENGRRRLADEILDRAGSALADK